VETDGIELVQHRFDGYFVQIEAHHRSGRLTVVWYEATRDDGLYSHIHVAPGPYESRAALIEAIELAIRNA
jgi:hypothetical protein